MSAINNSNSYFSTQHNSSAENNILEDGFLAGTLAEELPAAPGSRVLVTTLVEDVTDRPVLERPFAECLEIDTGAERPAATRQHQDADGVVARDAIDRPVEFVEHRRGDRVERVRAIEGDGGDGIAGVQLSRVASSIGGGDGPDRPLAAGAAAGRTDEEIQIVFDRYKAALYRLYNRELRKNPALRGQMVLRLTIEPDGSVSMCELQSSNMDAPALAQQVVDRVRTFDFGAKDVGAMTIIYPIDFLPAG